MALTDVPLWKVTVSMMDKDKNLSSTSFNLPGALDYADAETSAVAIVDAIDAITIAPIRKWEMTRGRVDPLVIAGTAPPAAQVESKGVFSFEASNGQVSTFQIPGIDPDLVIIGTNTINTTSGLIVAYRNAMLNTLLGAGNSPVTAQGADYVRVTGVPHKHTVKNEKG